MSEDLSALPSSTSVNSASVDPATGEVVGGLAGLREIIRVKNELLSQQPSIKEANLGSDGASNKTSQPTKRTRKSSRRRNRKKSPLNSPNNVAGDELVLPISREQVVYGEAVGQSGCVQDVRLYAVDNGRLYIYDSHIFAGQEKMYCQAALKILSDKVWFDMAKVANVQLFLNKRADLRVVDGELAYSGKYRIDCASEKVLEVVKRMVGDRSDNARDDNGRSGGKNMAVAHESGEVKIKTLDLVPKEKSVGEVIEADDDLVDKVVQIQRIAKRVAKRGDVDASSAMEVFLTFGRASADLICRVLEVDRRVAESVIDQLRLMHALGAPHQDGSYPIMVDSVAELGKNPDYTLRSQADNFRATVHVEDVRGRKLVYDLDELFMVKAADEYVSCLADFCRMSTSCYMQQLFDQHSDVVTVSDVLRATSADDKADGLNITDYELFHICVTKRMLCAGWLINNPTDGYPWVQFQVSRTNGLKIDTLRYLLANLSWLECSCDEGQMASLAAQVSNMVVTSELPGVRMLKEKLADKLGRLLRTGAGAVDNSQLSLADISDRVRVDNEL